jgi:hypothetical protein
MEDATYEYYKIVNNSDFKIRLNDYDNGKIYDSIIILENNYYEKFLNSDGDNGPALFPPFSDSVEVIFDDTLSIFHGSKNYNVNRNIKLITSYTGGERIESTNFIFEYHYEYIFTNADFEEALHLIDGK